MEAKKQPGRRNKNRASKTQHSINTVAHPDAAGIDIGAEELVVAVPHDRDAKSVRTFSTFTSGALAMRDWLVSCNISTVAVECTGNYWIATGRLTVDPGRQLNAGYSEPANWGVNFFFGGIGIDGRSCYNSPLFQRTRSS